MLGWSKFIGVLSMWAGFQLKYGVLDPASEFKVQLGT